MRVIAIDPGYDRIGIAVMEKQNQQENIIFSCCFETNKKEDLNSRFLALGLEVKRVIKKYKPDTMAIETLFFNKNTKTAIGVAEARGLIIYLGKEAGCTVYEFGPQEIKVAVTGYGKSDKGAVFSMLGRLIENLPEKALDDEYDAIAVGVTCLAHHSNTLYNPQLK